MGLMQRPSCTFLDRLLDTVLAGIPFFSLAFGQLQTLWHTPEHSAGGTFALLGRTTQSAEAPEILRSDIWDQILLDRRAGNWQAVLARLETVARVEPESYRLRQADLLKATALRKLSRSEEASTVLEQLQRQNSPLRPLILWRLFELARDEHHTGDALRWLRSYRS